MQGNKAAENVAIARHSVENVAPSSSDGVKEPDNNPPGGNGDQNVTLDDLFSGVSKIDKTKIQAALLRLLKSDMQTSENLSELFPEPCTTEEQLSSRVPQMETFPSQDVRLKRSASFPEINNSLHHSAGRSVYSWCDSDDDILDPTWLSVSESRSSCERNRWRKGLYSVYVGQLPADITKKELCELFSVAGNVQDLHLADSSGKSFTFGFVRFSSLREAKEAVQMCHSRLLGGRHIRVEFACETQRLLDKDGGDSSDTERDGKLLRGDYPSVQRYKPLSVDEADEKMVQWKLRQCTAKLKSSHACYVRDYMRTGEAAWPTTQAPSEVWDDQEETLSKIQKVLKKVAEIPGTEIAATAFGEQGPEHTIMSWYQENESVNKNTQLSSQDDRADATQNRNVDLQQSAVDSGQQLSAQIAEMSHVNGNAQVNPCKVLPDNSQCNLFPACGNTAQDIVAPVNGHRQPDGAAGDKLYSIQPRERPIETRTTACAQFHLQTYSSTSNTTAGSISKRSNGLTNSIAPAIGEKLYSRQGVEISTEASAAGCAQVDLQCLNSTSPTTAAGCAQVDLQCLNSTSPTTAHDIPANLQQHFQSVLEHDSATYGSPRYGEAANSSSECSPMKGLKSVQSGFARGVERQNVEPLKQPQFGCTLGQNTGVFGGSGRGRPSPPITACIRPATSDVLSPRQQQAPLPRNNPQLPTLEPNQAMWCQPISGDKDNKSLPNARRPSLENDIQREFREMGLCDFDKSPDRRYRSCDDIVTVPDSITVNPFHISPGVQSTFCAEQNPSYPPVSGHPDIAEQKEREPYLPSAVPSITRQQFTQPDVGLPQYKRQSSISGTRVEEIEAQETSPSAMLQPDESKVHRYPPLSQRKSPHTSTPVQRCNSAEGTSSQQAKQHRYPVPVCKKPVNQKVTQQKSGASESGEFSDPQTDQFIPLPQTSQTVGKGSLLVKTSAEQRCCDEQTPESTANQQTSTQQVADHTVNDTHAPNQLLDQAPVNQHTRDCVTSCANQPVTSKDGAVTAGPDPRMNAARSRNHNLVGSPLRHHFQHSGVGHFNPNFEIYAFLLSQQIAQQQRSPFSGSPFQPIQPPQFGPQFPSNCGFQRGHNVYRKHPYFGPRPRQRFPGNITADIPCAQLPRGLVDGQLPREFTPPQGSQFPFHHRGTNTWPLQQRPLLFPQSPPFLQQNFRTPPRQPFAGNAFGNGINPRKLAPFLTGSPLFSDPGFSVDLGRIREMRKDPSIAKTMPTVGCSPGHENRNGQNRPSDMFCAKDAKENGKEESSCIINNTESGSLSDNSEIKDFRLLKTNETVDITDSATVAMASATKHDSSASASYNGKTVDKPFAHLQSQISAVTVKLNSSSSDSVNASDTSQSSSTDDISSSDSSMLVESPYGKESNSSSNLNAHRNRKLASPLQVVINTDNKDPGYSSTSSGSEETERTGVRTKNVGPDTGRGTGDSGIVSPADDLSKNEITLLELKMELQRIKAENKQLQHYLPKASSPVLSSRIYPIRASAALKQKINELEVQLQREKEIITARNSEQELLYEREKLEAAFDRQLLKQLEVELAIDNITNRVRLARMQQELLRLYQQHSV